MTEAKLQGNFIKKAIMRDVFEATAEDRFYSAGELPSVGRLRAATIAGGTVLPFLTLAQSGVGRLFAAASHMIGTAPAAALWAAPALAAGIYLANRIETGIDKAVDKTRPLSGYDIEQCKPVVGSIATAADLGRAFARNSAIMESSKDYIDNGTASWPIDTKRYYDQNSRLVSLAERIGLVRPSAAVAMRNKFRTAPVFIPDFSSN